MTGVTAEIVRRKAEPQMHEGYGSLAKAPPKYVADNDNVAGGAVCPAGYTIDATGKLSQTATIAHVKDAIVPKGHRRNYVWSGEASALVPFYPSPTSPHPATPIARQGDFMQTFTGRKFWPMDPRADEVHIEDIAHALAMQCRYGGHCVRFYSVAEHSVHIAWWLFRNYGPEAALCGLLHDASEAYVTDVIRPIKPFLSNYKEIEAGVMVAVRERFHLPEMPASVHEADTRILGDELANMAPMDWHARYDDPLNVVLDYLVPEAAEKRFLATFEALSAECEAGRV